jgi:hypothetical protein
MYKKVFFKLSFFFFFLFVASVSIVYSLNPSYLFLEKTQTNTSNIDMVLLITPSGNFSSGGEVTISFPDADDGQWCKSDGAFLTATGISSSKINMEGWDIDYPLPGDLVAQCFQGSGLNSHDRIVISELGALLPGVSYAVEIASSPSFSTGFTGGSNNVIVQLKRGLIVESVAYAVYLQAPGGVTVSAFVDEDFFSTVQVLDPVVEKGIWSRVRVRVLDSKGNPLPGRQVEVNLDLTGFNSSNWIIENPTGATNSSGVFQTRIRGFETGIVTVGATDKSFSQDVTIQDTDNLTVTVVPTITLHQLPMYTSGLSRKITWSSLSGNYEYFIEASLDPNFNVLEKTSGWITGNEYTFQNLENGKAYYYRGKVRNIAHVESAYSNIVSSIQAERPSGVIQVLDPIVEKGIWARVRITLVDSGGNPLSGRRIVFNVDRPMANWEIEQPSALTNSNGVTEGRIRGFEVATVRVTAEDRTIPMHFQIDGFDWLQVRELPSLTLNSLPNYSKGLSRRINWNNVLGNYQYLIQASKNSNFTSPMNSGWLSSNQFTFTNLVHAQGYFYRGKLRNSAGVESSYSNIVSSIQDNEAPSIENVDFEIISQNEQRKAKFTFLIKDLSRVTNVQFKCKDDDEIYISCGSVSSLNDFHYILFSKEDLLPYEIAEDEYSLEYCIRADDIVGNRGEYCEQKVFNLEAVEVVVEEEVVEEEKPDFKANVITRITAPVREAAKKNIENTVAYVQDLNLDDRKIVTASVSLASTVAPVTFLSVFFNPANFYPIGQLFLGVLGVFRRKDKILPYGYVYDAITKEPINRAIVRIYKEGKLVATTVSNVYGVFTAKLKPGEYFLKVSATGYLYPSKLVTGSTDSPLQNIYRGGKFEVKEELHLQYSIPLDPFDPSNAKYFKIMLVSRLGKLFLVLQKIFVVVGLFLAFFLYLRNPVTFNLIIVILYIPLLFIHLFLSFSGKRQTLGMVKNTKGESIGGVTLGLREMEFEKLVAKRVTNEKGHYKFLVPGGKYRLEILSSDYEIKEPKEGALYFKGDVKKPLLIHKNLVLEEK